MTQLQPTQQVFGEFEIGEKSQEARNKFTN
jgi:hypothetical protein